MSGFDVPRRPVRSPTAGRSYSRRRCSPARRSPQRRRVAIPDHLRDGVDALFVPPGDLTALAGAIGILLSDAALAERLARAAAGSAAKRSFEKMAERIMREYAATLRETGGGWPPTCRCRR